MFDKNLIGSDEIHIYEVQSVLLNGINGDQKTKLFDKLLEQIQHINGKGEPNVHIIILSDYIQYDQFINFINKNIKLSIEEIQNVIQEKSFKIIHNMQDRINTLISIIKELTGNKMDFDFSNLSYYPRRFNVEEHEDTIKNNIMKKIPSDLKKELKKSNIILSDKKEHKYKPEIHTLRSYFDMITNYYTTNPFYIEQQQYTSLLDHK